MRKESMAVETEKVCVNLSAAELGKIDLLVAQGLYTNRSDVIRGGLQLMFSGHDSDIERGTRALGAAGLGLMSVTRHQLEEAVRHGRRLDTRVIGILVITSDVTPELALNGFGDIYILGSIRGPKDVIDAIEGKIRKRLF